MAAFLVEVTEAEAVGVEVIVDVGAGVVVGGLVTLGTP